MSNPQDSTSKLRETLHFTDETLAINRTGQFTEAQRQQYVKWFSMMRSGAIMMLPVEGAILAVTAIILFVGSSDKVFTLVAVLLFSAALLGYSLLRVLNFARAAKTLSLRTAEGIVHLAPIHERNGTLTGYSLRIGSLKFSMFADAADGFQDQSAYRIYYVMFPGGKHILSAEPVMP